MPHIALNDIQMYYERVPCTGTGAGTGADAGADAGAGTVTGKDRSKAKGLKSDKLPLLLLSGMASDSASWQPVVADLSQHFELIIPDNRCTGRTQPNPVDTSREQMVDDLVALLDKLSISQVNVLGHSMGAMLGWALAAHAPHRVCHLISASAQGWVSPARVSLFRSLAALRTAHNEPQWFELLFHFLFSPTFFASSEQVQLAVQASLSYANKQSLEAFAAQGEALSSFVTPVDISAISCPVSLLTGANDVLMTPAQLEAFGNEHAIPVSVLPDAAHALHWENTQGFVQFVITQLTRGKA